MKTQFDPFIFASLRLPLAYPARLQNIFLLFCLMASSSFAQQNPTTPTPKAATEPERKSKTIDNDRETDSWTPKVRAFTEQARAFADEARVFAKQPMAYAKDAEWAMAARGMADRAIAFSKDAMIYAPSVGKAYRFAEGEGTPIEKKKTLNFNYSVNPTDRLQISNQFGEVKIELWDKKEIKVEVTVIGRSNSDKKAQEYVDGVEIVEHKEGGKFMLKTEIDNVGDGWWGWKSWSKKSDDEPQEEKRGVEVNYAVFMPRTNPLTVSDKYGKIIMADFSAPLKITSNYGSFTANNLTGPDKDIFVQYGSSKIRQVDDGDLKIYYSKLTLEKADKLHLQNNYGSLSIDEVNEIDAQIQYSSGKIGKLRDSGKFNISYSSDFSLPVLSKSLKSLDVKSNYTAVRLPVNDENNFDFQVDVNYSNFRYPSGKATFTQNPDENEDDDRKPYHFVSNKTYKGKYGKTASTTTVNIKANYAPVKFVEKAN